MKNKRAFTLAEVLIALIITSFLLTALLTTFQAGLQAYQRLEINSNLNHQTRILLAKLDRELNNITAYKKVPFKGSAHAFSFTTTSQDYLENHQYSELTLVEYHFERGRLFRKEAPLRYSFNQKQSTAVELSQDFTDFNLEYAYYDSEKESIIWLPDWPEELGLPKGIRLSVALLDKQNSKKKLLKTQKHFYIQQGNWGWIPKVQS